VLLKQRGRGGHAARRGARRDHVADAPGAVARHGRARWRAAPGESTLAFPTEHKFYCPPGSNTTIVGAQGWGVSI
jgi:hypothetical protein